MTVRRLGWRSVWCGGCCWCRGRCELPLLLLLLLLLRLIDGSSNGVGLVVALASSFLMTAKGPESHDDRLQTARQRNGLAPGRPRPANPLRLVRRKKGKKKSDVLGC